VTEIAEADGLSVANVMHAHVSTLPADVSVGDVRAYFAVSTSRRLALLVDGDRYVSSLSPMALPEDAAPDALAAEYAAEGPVLHPDAPATEGRDLTLATPERRLPVVDESGALVGVVAIDMHLTRFCGT
jgi:CBS domain-containing protein